MEEQQERFLQAIYAAQDEVGHARARVIAERLGLDIINTKADRDLYQQTTLELQDSGHLECLAIDDRVTCGIVMLTESGLAYVVP